MPTGGGKPVGQGEVGDLRFDMETQAAPLRPKAPDRDLNALAAFGKDTVLPKAR